MNSIRLIIILILSLPLIWFLLPKQPLLSNNLDAIDDFIPALMQEAAIPGLAIARISANQSEIHTYGFANVERNVLVSEHTLFNIASISKPIMGVVLLQLVDQGKLELDRDINDYLPFKVDNPNLKDETITLRHLVTHTSGIADYYNVDSYAINQDSTLSLEQHLRSLLTAKGSLYNNGEYYLNYPPGTKRKYSNLAAGLAGYLVEATTGTSLSEYSQQHLFKSLAMQQTSWLLADLPIESIALPYEVQTCIPYFFICADTQSAELNYLIGEYFNPPSQHKSFQPYPHFGNPQYPDGGVRTSITDLSQFLVRLLQNQDVNANNILSDAMFNEMLKLQLPNEVSDSQRFFWRDNSMGMIGHMGSDLGVFTALYFDPKTQEGFIILMNRGMDNKAALAMKKIALKLMQI